MIKASLVVLALIFAAVTIQVVLCQTNGGQGASLDIPPPSPSTASSGGGGSSHRQIDFDKILKAVQEGKQKKPEKFEELKKLLYIEPFSTVPYSTNLSLGLSISGNKTQNRKDKFTVTAIVINPNPIEVRRALYLYLEALEPGDNSFQKVNPIAQIVQINEYEEDGHGKNITARAFPDLTSFSHLKIVGPAILRLQVSDGQYNWHSQNLTLNVTNQPPRLENLTITAPPNPWYNDAIMYIADVIDSDGDQVNVTLHVLDDHGLEHSNKTQIISGEGQTSFLGNEFFRESDAGKNFTYYYTFGDGITTNETDNQDGPRLRKSVSIYVEKPWVIPEDENQYWWQSYNFGLKAKSKDTRGNMLTVTLYTDTLNHPDRVIASRTVYIPSDNFTVINFDGMQPFNVADCNQTFRYYFTYSAPDQDGRMRSDLIEGSRPINSKLIRYQIHSPIMVLNLLFVIGIAFFGGIMIERKFYRKGGR